MQAAATRSASFPQVLRADAARIEAHAQFLAQGDATLDAAMLYALEGGKMLRGFLVLEGARLFGVPEKAALNAALAIECMHAYSLIHDDLPCMDDDGLRRGKPTVHRQWDEATAVLAGDALQALAFELLTGPEIMDSGLADGGTVAARLCAGLSRAAGRRGMVLGQMEDIAAETAAQPLTLPQIEGLQSRKTGALLIWSAQAGAVLGGADTAPLSRYGAALGLAFQIWDDVLDVEGDADALGKAVQKDAERGKATFVSLLGLQGAKDRAAALVTDACDALSVYGEDAETLREAARFVIARSN